MAGIYFHIPFCKQACYYCDFHFSTSLRYKEEMLNALKNEFLQRKKYLNKTKIESIYFGGGSPSILAPEEIQSLIDLVKENFEVKENAEITLEANPDDLYSEKVRGFKKTNINRFSIGIQSFHEEDLKWMNRAHNADEARTCIKRVQDAGFENITCDLIYGYPLLTDEKWVINIEMLTDFKVPHLSCYGMTVEPRTALASFIRKGKTAPMDDEQAAQQFLYLIKSLGEKGYIHYEISNFAKEGHLAKHNTNYWKGVPYLGIGPSAHSFDGKSRSWNIANNALYIQKVEHQLEYQELEILSAADQYNEYVMTSLRTIWGIDLHHIQTKHGEKALTFIIQESQVFERQGYLSIQNEHIQLTTKGKLMADHIASELFILE